MAKEATRAGAMERRMSIGAQRNPASQEAILKAAEELLLEGGLATFSIEAVARRAKAGKPTIYRWWPNKATLLLDVYHRQKEAVPTPDTGSAHEDLYQFLLTLIGYWREGNAGAIFRSVIAEAQIDPAAAEALSAYAKLRRGMSEVIIHRAKQRGEIADWVNAELAIETISAFAWNRLLTSRLEPDQQELRLFVRQFLQGIAPR